MKHVTSEEVIKIHDLMLQCYGECPRCADPGKATALIARV